MHEFKFSFKNRHQKFTNIFCDILPAEKWKLWKINEILSLIIFFETNLVKYVMLFTTSKGQHFHLNSQANVILISRNFAHK
jgi:hypothetical protein